MKNWSERITAAFRSNKAERDAQQPKQNLFLGRLTKDGMRQVKLKATRKNELLLAKQLLTLEGGMQIEVDKLEVGGIVKVFNENKNQTMLLPGGKYNLKSPKGIMIVNNESVIKHLDIK